MQTRTLDHIIRDTLNQLGYPLHFYTLALLYAIREYEEMQKMFPFKAKQIEKSVTDYQRISLPSDFAGLIDVSLKKNEYLLPLVKDDQINKLYRYNDSGNKIAYPDDTSTDFLGNFFSFDANGTAISLEREHLGRQFGYSRGQEFTFTFDRENEEIVFSNKVTFDTVVLTYISNSIETTAANLIDHIHVDRLEKAIKYSFAKYVRVAPTRLDVAYQEYKNAKRLHRARQFPIRAQDLIYNIRQGVLLSAKN